MTRGTWDQRNYFCAIPLSQLGLVTGQKLDFFISVQNQYFLLKKTYGLHHRLGTRQRLPIQHRVKMIPFFQFFQVFTGKQWHGSYSSCPCFLRLIKRESCKPLNIFFIPKRISKNRFINAILDLWSNLVTFFTE